MKRIFPLVVIRKMSICSKKTLFPLIISKSPLDKNELILASYRELCPELASPTG